MGREKRTPVEVAEDGTLSTSIGNIDDAPNTTAPAEAAAAGEPAAAAPAPPPTRTRDRDPADREQWKRERAAALGIPRD